MSTSILIIDEDTELTAFLTLYLTKEGYVVYTAHDGEEGLKKALNQSVDLIILDLMLPKLNGFEVLKTIREHFTLPVILLTACKDTVHCLVGFELGADDYLTKPCHPRELLARIHAVLHRSPKTSLTKPVINCHSITIDCGQRTALLAGHLLDLTNTEFNILEILIKSPGQAFSKEELTEYALGRKYTAYDRSIDVHISNLRNKLGNNPMGETFIKTVRGFGYVFNI